MAETPLVFFDRLKKSIGINCFPQDEQSLEVNGVNMAKSAITRTLSDAVTILQVDSYTIIPLDTSNQTGKLTVAANGGVMVGKGLSKVTVSGMVSHESQATSVKKAAVIKNGSPVAEAVKTITQGTTDQIIIIPTLIDVQENDVIQLCYYTDNSNDSISAGTTLTVET